jgi:hypothetical protein
MWDSLGRALPSKNLQVTKVPLLSRINTQSHAELPTHNSPLLLTLLEDRRRWVQSLVQNRVLGAVL